MFDICGSTSTPIQFIMKNSLSSSTESRGLGFHNTNTLFATADDELRPVMNGIFMELSTDDLTFVASDAHKLVRYRRKDASSEFDSSFILPKKPAGLLKQKNAHRLYALGGHL